jgi:GntR family transcriptional regulator/MocR family aminotransferase
MKMPGTRELSKQLAVHRKTLVSAYDELDAQGWIHSLPSKGTFVSDRLPEIRPRKLETAAPGSFRWEKTGFTFRINPFIKPSSKPLRDVIGFHDGPDVRLVPVDAWGRAYRSVLARRSGLHHLSYVQENGNYELRKVLSEELNTTRGMQTTPDHIFITRGSQMAMFMLAMVLISDGDLVAVGQTNYYYTDRALMTAGAKLIRIPVDDEGIDVDELENVCSRKKIRAIYVTSHHHFPTTVTLCASRRMKLLALAEKYGFIIIEDDYDYDLHYESSPLLPVASADRNGMVVYIGTLSKTIAPALRLGYVAAPLNLTAELGKIRQVIDIQGDPVLEQAVAEMFSLGEIRRHMKKALREYHIRRDYLCGQLNKRFRDVIQFKTPEGGLSVWARFDKRIPLPALHERMKMKGVIISPGLIHNTDPKMNLNATRMGFGWMTTHEAARSLDVLQETIAEMRKG